MRVFALSMLALVTMLALPANAQQYKYQTPMPPGVATPDKLDTSIGTLNLSDGYPDAATVQKVYDNLDASRALQAFLFALPIVNQAGMREAIRKFGPDNQTDVIMENLTDSRSIQLTPNDDTIYYLPPWPLSAPVIPTSAAQLYQKSSMIPASP